MSNLSTRKVISLAILFSFIIVQFALISPSVSAQGQTPPPGVPSPTPMLDTPTPAQSFSAPVDKEQSVTDAVSPLELGWSLPFNISATDSDSSQPNVTVDANGSVHVVWREVGTDGKGDILYRYKDFVGWSTTINVSQSSLFDSYNPQVVVDSNGRANIIWDERDSDFYSGNSEIWFRQCAGQSCSTPVSLSDSSGWTCGKYFSSPFVFASEIPVLGIDQGDQLIAEWRAYQYRELTMPYTVWSSSGSPTSQPTGCVPRGSGVTDRNMGGSRLMGGTPGNFGLVLDEQRSDGNQGVYYTRYSNGQWATPSFLEAGGSPDIYMDPINDELHLTWCSGGNLRYWDSATPTFQTVPGAVCTWYSPIARDVDGFMHVVWSESGKIYESKKFPEGWSEKVSIWQTPAGASAPDMVADQNGRLHLVWQEFIDGDWEVFYLTNSAHDCSGTTLSPIAQAVKNVVGEQAYCGNYYESEDENNDGMIGLITLPPGEDAFERFGALARTTRYEIDFVNMEWDPDENPDATADSPGEKFLQGVKELYDAVKDPEAHGKPADYFAGGVRVRILLGYKVKDGKDQRLSVLEDLSRLQIDRSNPELGWTVEVATYRDDAWGKHSHVKMMIVDGKDVIAAGYNMHYIYLRSNPSHDMGIEISGPIAQDALQVFDGLWAGAHSCVLANATYDECIDDSDVDLSHNPAVLVPIVKGNDIAFSLFRNHDDKRKLADNAIFAAVRAAEREVNIIQNRFAPHKGEYIPLYMRAVLDALQKGDGQVQVNLLVTGTDNLEFLANLAGICDLQALLLIEDSSGTHALAARYSTPENPIHTKALSIDGHFVIAGSQNWDPSAWGDDASSTDFFDLAEYSLGVDSEAAATHFNTTFWNEWEAAAPALCADGSQSSVQTAIDQASPGTAIFIPGGVYTGSITVDKPVVLVGAGNNETIFQPQNNEPAFRITSNDVVISNMRIGESAGYGIELIETAPGSPRNIQINRVVFENNAQGGIFIQGLTGGSPTNYTIENNTFIGGADGVAIDMPEAQVDTSIIRNNIFYGQSMAPIHILSQDDNKVEYSYNLFDNCGAGNCATNWRLGNMNGSSSEHDNLFDLDPLFADAANGAYQLSAGSPAIDAGDPSLLHETFYDGDNDGMAQIDIGAFEFNNEIAPTVSSVQIAIVQQGTVDFTVTFSEPVTGVDVTDFTLTTTNAPGAAISNVSGSGTTYMVSINIGTGDGTIRLDVLDDDTILDLGSNPLGGGFTGGETYAIPDCNLVTHSPEILSGNTMSMTITNPTTMALDLDDIFVRWDHDRGHAVGLDKSLILQRVALGSTILWSGSQAGPTYTFLTNATLPVGTSTITFTFHQAYERSDGSENIRINLATSGCQVYPIDSDNLLTQTPGAKIDTFIGGVKQGSDFVANNTSQQKSYVGVNTGPVKIASTNTVPMIASERVIYKVNNVDTSYSEMMGLPNDQLDTIYWLPWYNNNLDLDTQLRVANVSPSAATVQVYIEGVLKETFSLPAGQSVLKSYAGVNTGPVKIVSTQQIVAAARMIYTVNGVQTSFSEIMALPEHQLDRAYALPWYNNVDLDTQLRFANVDSYATATIHVYIGGVEVDGSPFTLLPGKSIRKSFAGLNTGPVKIVSDEKILVSERVIYPVNGTNTSYSEMMALPGDTFVANRTYYLPWYNNVDMDTQLRFSNLSLGPAIVRVYIGGVEMLGSPFTLEPGTGIRQSFPGINSSAVRIVSTRMIAVSERVIYKVNGIATSYSETMALPDSWLDTIFWMPWYNNVGLDTNLIFGVP